MGGVGFLLCLSWKGEKYVVEADLTGGKMGGRGEGKCVVAKESVSCWVGAR